MREKFLKKGMSKIRKKYPDYAEEKFEVIEYGLETLYINVTKIAIITLLSILTGVFKEMMIILLFFNTLRTTAFGMHAKKSSHCYIISITLFIGGAFICKYMDINFYVKLIISIISIIFLAIYAPADTYKRPLVNAKKRKAYKIVTIITSLIFLSLLIIFKDNKISDMICIGIFNSMLMIHPLTYRMFQLPYNNYKTYKAC